MTDSARKPSRRNALLEQLCAAYSVFRDGQPLAIGIHKTIQERMADLDKAELRSAMKAHTASTRYLKAIVEGAKRLDLDGNEAGAVTAEQHEQAATLLRERFKKAADRRREEKEAEQRQEKLLKLAEKFNNR